jgi:hypothetical protein
VLITALMNPHEAHKEQPRSHLFTMRLWIEELGHGQREVRMQIRHVLSGETRYFREWTHLAEYLERKLQATNQAGSSKAGNMD